ncbi:Myb-like DNA-binding domain [Musa troglodytarum]|uniref:Myb-like DNA-binding domain n=1 Tax=Musa troglodytarum TaxID=320322 RepID=A0A9E7K8U6_9LILI|nr:Myb-like DNA-binding domain [Musa troglodytarum]
MMKGLEKENDPTSVAPPAVAPPPKKDRHVVTWTPREDDLLREHIAVHGTADWRTITALFNDKTSRQCRRRWYTYMNSECKKGGWSAEEDMLLCEAQKIFGNRWTEIAKVVSGRTDNAVKNRFSTLCKKRAKLEAVSKENKSSSSDLGNKRVIIQDRFAAAVLGESSVSNKKISVHLQGRYHISHPKEIVERHRKLHGEHVSEQNQQRPPLAALVQNINSVNGLTNNTRGSLCDASNKDNQGTFLRKNDPKLTALLQQAESLTSLSMKVNAEDTNQSSDEAWKELQDYLIQTEDGESLTRRISRMGCIPDELRSLIEDVNSTKEEGQQQVRQFDSDEDSQGSSECSTGSTHNVNAGESGSIHHYEDCLLHRDNEVSHLKGDAAHTSMNSSPETILSLSPMPKDEIVNGCTISEFTSPLQTIPLFQSFADGIPTPVFTSSERNFLLSVLDFSSMGTNTNSSEQPSCKKVLLHSFKPS